MSFAATPVEYGELVERGAEVLLGESLDVVGEVDVGVLAGRVMEKTMGRERRGGGGDLLIQRPLAGEDVLAEANKVGTGEGIRHSVAKGRVWST